MTLDDALTRDDMASKRVALTSTLKDKAQNVLNELGQNALSSGYWNNGLGQMGIYVNEAGIHILTGSKNAIAFTRDVTHAYRIKAADADGSLEVIENSLFANGSVDVEIFLNINNTDYEIDSAGNTYLNHHLICLFKHKLFWLISLARITLKVSRINRMIFQSNRYSEQILATLPVL